MAYLVEAGGNTIFFIKVQDTRAVSIKTGSEGFFLFIRVTKDEKHLYRGVLRGWAIVVELDAVDVDGVGGGHCRSRGRGMMNDDGTMKG